MKNKPQLVVCFLLYDISTENCNSYFLCSIPLVQSVPLGSGAQEPFLGWDRILQLGLCTSILNISFLSEANRAYPYLNANFLVKTLPC